MRDRIRAWRFVRLSYRWATTLADGQAAAVLDGTAPPIFDPTDPRRVYDLSKALGGSLTLTRTDGKGAVARLSNVFGLLMS